MSYLKNGILKENPIFVLLLGLCPVLAVTSRFDNAIGMGVGVTFVLLGSNTVVSMLKNFIPKKIRIPSYIVIIASFVTIVDMVMAAFAPDLHRNLGVFVPLIVVNCVILGRAEGFASKNSIKDSVKDAFGMGLGFLLGLCLIAFVRELLGAGTITLFPVGTFDGIIRVPGLYDSPVRAIALATGALLVVGYLKAFFTWAENKKIGVSK